ncbi:MAG: hypothetical protein J6K48_00125 [Lachnospiraceae bacterium]|nr:hypothetical protein [Lachnospiraceae bacterium]
MQKNVIIVCEDLFGLEIYSILNEINGYVEKERLSNDTYNIMGFISNHSHPFRLVDNSIKPILGDIDSWQPTKNEQYVMGIKNPESKEHFAKILKDKGADFLTILTPWTLVPDHLHIGEGCVISNYSFKDGAVFDEFVTMINVMAGAAHVGAYTTIDALANITNADIGKKVRIGSHAFLMEHIQIGDNVQVYSGSMVFANIKPDQKVAGIPANKMKYRKIVEEE